MTTDKIIMYSSPEAASKKGITSWVDNKEGRCWPDEHAARWYGCTHIKCKCGIPRYIWGYCPMRAYPRSDITNILSRKNKEIKK